MKICSFCNKEILEIKCNHQKYHTECAKKVHLQKVLKFQRENPRKVNKKYKRYYSKNKGKISNRRKIIRAENNNASLKKYRKNNPKKIIQWNMDYNKRRKRKDIAFKILSNLRTRLYQAVRAYSKTGKIMNSRDYGIDYEKIIEHLKPFPNELNKYHIDHIKPLCSFDLTNPEEVSKAFAPENHQWLLAEENLRKKDKTI